MKNKIVVQNTEIKVNSKNKLDYISLTDIARYKDSNRSDYILQNWMRSKDTIEFLGLWEKINNDNFNSIEFDRIKNQAGVNSFILTPKQWILKTIPQIVDNNRVNHVYAHEADILNIALFGMTAKEFREQNTNKKGNLRDFATVEHLVVLSNLESINSMLIKQGLSQKERLIKLNEVAISQMKSLFKINTIKRLK